MLCFEQSTGKIYEYEFVEDYVRIWTKNMQLHEVISYTDWDNRYVVLSSFK